MNGIKVKGKEEKTSFQGETKFWGTWKVNLERPED